MSTCETFKIECYLSEEERFKQKIKGIEDKLNWEKLCRDGIIPVSQLVEYQKKYKFNLSVYPLHELPIKFFVDFSQFFNWDPITNESFYQRFNPNDFQYLYEKGLIKKEYFKTIAEKRPDFYHFMYYTMKELVETKSTFIMDLLEDPEIFELLLNRSILNASSGYYKWEKDDNKIPILYNNSTIFRVIDKFKNYLLENDTYTAKDCLRLIITVQMVEFFHNCKDIDESGAKEVTKAVLEFYQSIKNSIKHTGFNESLFDEVLLSGINKVFDKSGYKCIPPAIMELIFRMNWTNLFYWLDNNKRGDSIPYSYRNRCFYWIRKKIYIAIFK